MFTVIMDPYAEKQPVTIRGRPIFEYADFIRVFLGHFFADVSVDPRNGIQWLVPGKLAQRPSQEDARQEISALRTRLLSAVRRIESVCSTQPRDGNASVAENLLLAEVLSRVTLPASVDDACFTEDSQLVLLRWGLDGVAGSPRRLTREAVDRFVEQLARKHGISMEELLRFNGRGQDASPRLVPDRAVVPVGQRGAQRWVRSGLAVLSIVTIIALCFFVGVGVGRMGTPRPGNAIVPKQPAPEKTRIEEAQDVLDDWKDVTSSEKAERFVSVGREGENAVLLFLPFAGNIERSRSITCAFGGVPRVLKDVDCGLAFRKTCGRDTEGEGLWMLWHTAEFRISHEGSGDAAAGGFGQ